MKRFFIILLVFLSAVSCRFQPELETSVRIDFWSSLFDYYWNSMNRNYVFWALDSPSDEWDRVYDTYLPLFEELDAASDAYAEETAFRYFYEISQELSDGHYSLKLGEHLQSTFSRKLLQNAGYSDEEILNVLWSGNLKEVLQQTEYAENASSILSVSIGINLPLQSEADVFQKVDASEYFTELYVLQLYDERQSDPYSYYALGRTADGIIYILLNDFNFSGNLGSDAALEFISTWLTMITNEATGLVVDLRGNSGGYNSDIDLLWSCLISENVYFAEYRTKDGMNRLDYGPCVRYLVHPRNDKNFNAPIAVIANNATVSNGEISLLFFKGLEDFYGFDTETFGSTTSGGLGTASNADPYYYNAGKFSYQNVLAISTQNSYCRYRDGRNFEETGIEPDHCVPMSLSRGKDKRLDAALEWVRSR